VQKPYLYSSVDTGVDPAGVALPTVTTINSFDAMGNPTRIAVTTGGTALGMSQYYIRVTYNTYQPANTAGDNWVLGRLLQATHRNIIPNSLPAISTAPGPAPNAAATAGSVQ
jgi:hypothetical protein